MSEMTVEQAKYCLELGSDCDICELKTKCKSGSLNLSARKMAIKALEENEKLKSECQKTYNQLMEVEKDAQEEIARLNYKIKDLFVEKDVLNKIIDNLESQITGVEVLEWIYKWRTDEQFAENTFDSNCAFIDHIFDKYTPQEIVYKIQEYEENNSNRNSNSGAGTQKESEKIEFKVGDIVYHNGRNFTVTEVTGRSLHCVNDNEDYWILQGACKLVEHAELPEEEPQVEWVWECFAEQESIGIYLTEQEAIKWCEDAMKGYTDDYVWYRKVCRRK